jgi:hypothetical protein
VTQAENGSTSTSAAEAAAAVSQGQGQGQGHARTCPTCRRKLPGRPRTIRGKLPEVESGQIVGPSVAGKILGGLSLEQIAAKAPGGLTSAQLRRLDRDLQPRRAPDGSRLYDLAKLLEVAQQMKPRKPPDITGEWLTLRAVVELTGLQEQTIRAADDRLQPRRPLQRGKPGPRLYHRSVVYQEMLRIGQKFTAAPAPTPEASAEAEGSGATDVAAPDLDLEPEPELGAGSADGSGGG